MNNTLTYKQNGDYLIPNLELSQQPNQPLGKYGRMRKAYLKQHRPVIYSQMLLSETLYPHLAEIEQTANSRMEQMMPGLMQAAGVTESLKASNQMMWVGLMNNCKAQAEEIILKELIHS
ncbi:MAG: TnpV protein [Lachnospiraceae bacterium]|nr:TnpV protein [Lachnospiraceae bacterium]